MWICGINSFLSIVQDPSDPGTLVVRARRQGDLERVFPGCEVVMLDGRDYSFRTFLPRDFVADVIASQIRRIDYGNFKNAVKDGPLHTAYAAVWSVMARLQKRLPYASHGRPSAGKRPPPSAAAADRSLWSRR